MKKKAEKHPSSIYQELCKKIGKEKVTDDETILTTYGFDYSAVPFSKPSLIVLPESREDVKKVLKVANAHSVPVTAMSAGVSQSGLSVPSEGGIVMDFRKMDRILEINTDSWYAVIEPGVTFNKFTYALREKGFRCHIPTAPGSTMPLTNYMLTPSGSLANRHYDSIVSLEVVIPDGTVIHTGSDAWPSVKPFKRYGIYPDLTGLFCCSYGTLGVVTKGSVRIYPINESNRINLTAFDDYASSVKFVKDIIGSNIPEHCIIWNWQAYRTYDIAVQRYEEPYVPPELFQDPRKAPKDLPYNIVTTLMSGYEEGMVVAERICEKVAKKYGGRVVPPEELAQKCPGAMQAWKSFYGEYRQPGMYHSKKYGIGQYIPFIVQATPEDVVKVEKLALDSLCDIGLKTLCYYSQPYDFGRAMFFRVFTFVDPLDKEYQAKIRATCAKLYTTAMEKYGAVRNRARGFETGLLAQMGGYGDLLQRIKNVVDPNNILNPNLIF